MSRSNAACFRRATKKIEVDELEKLLAECEPEPVTVRNPDLSVVTAIIHEADEAAVKGNAA